MPKNRKSISYRLFLFLICLIFICTTTNKTTAQTSLPTDTLITTPLKGLKINVLAHDFGTIQKGQEATYNFIILNETNTPQIIDNVRTLCGCTAADWDDTPILPNTTVVLPVSYDAHKRGAFEMKAKVYFKHFRKPLVLTVSGTVE